MPECAHNRRVKPGGYAIHGSRSRQHRAPNSLALLLTASLLATAVIGGRAQTTSESPSENSLSTDSQHVFRLEQHGSGSGVLQGRLTDNFARPLEHSNVVARNIATGTEYRTTTGENGIYRLAGLEAGEYVIEADSPELGHGSVDGVIVTSGHATKVVVALNMALPELKLPGATHHDLTPTTAVLSTKLDGEQLKTLPITGRDWGNFALETPHATAPHENPAPKGQSDTTQNPGSTIEHAGLRAAGALGTANVIDGMDVTSGFKSRGWGHSSGAPMAEAAIAQVEAQAGNGEVEAGRAAAGEITAHSAQGSNGFHGQAFVYDRGNFFTALNPLTTWVKETAQGSNDPLNPKLPVFTASPYSPSDQEITFGVGVGRHIQKDRLFWFAALDGYLRDNPAVSMLRNQELFYYGVNDAGPQADAMTLLATQLGLTGNPVIQGFDAYGGLLENLTNLLGPTPRSSQQWIGFGRLDWQQNERSHWTGEVNGAHWYSNGGTLTRTNENFGNHSFGISKANELWALARNEYFLTPNLLAVTQASWGRDVLSEEPGTPSAFEKPFLINVWGQLPEITVDSRYGFKIGKPHRLGKGPYPDERRVQATEQVDWVHKNNLIKFGVGYGHIQDIIGVLLNGTGTYSYSSAEDFASDALVFLNFGIAGELNKYNPRNCNPTHTAEMDPSVPALGYLPCYSHYSQTMGPSGWSLSTNDWSAYVTEQWQFKHHLTVSAALRWELEQLPPPISRVANADLPAAGHLPSLGSDWGPRLSMAWAMGGKHAPVLRLGYGMYYGRTENATIETALTHTGAIKAASNGTYTPVGDLNLYFRPLDNLNGGGAPPFPYVFAGAPLQIVKPGVVEIDKRFKNPEVHQAIVAIEESLPKHIEVTASAMVSLGRRLPTSIDTNIDPNVAPGLLTYAVEHALGFPTGPIKGERLTVDYYANWPAGACPSSAPRDSIGQCGRLNPNYQQIADVQSKANSTYEAAMFRINRYGRKGLNLYLHYTYSHAMDWNPNETTQVAGSDVFDPAVFLLEYGTSDLDVRHSAGGMVEWTTPWKMHALAGKFVNQWRISAIGNYKTGRPYSMRTIGSVPSCVAGSGQLCIPAYLYGGTGSVTEGTIVQGFGASLNGFGGDNRIAGIDELGNFYNIGRNTFRYPSTWRADMRLGKKIELGRLKSLELLAESFNLFNHQNTTQIETVGYTISPGTQDQYSGLPKLTFMDGAKKNSTAFGQPMSINATNYYRPREFEIGLRLRF